MKLNYLHKFLMIALFICFGAVSYAQPSWTFTNTGSNHTILVQSGTVTISGTAISIGDYIGVFFLDGTNYVCGGFSEWTGSASNAITAWGDDTQSPVKDGFSANEAFNWKVWRASDGQIIDMTATYVVGGPFPNVGNYTTNGMSSILEMTGNAVVLPLNATGVSSSVLCFGGSSGTIDVTPSGGVPPYAYLWSNGATTQDLSGLSAGTYIITVTGASGGITTMPWTFTNTGSNHTILLLPNTITINGSPIGVGDYIGAFFIDGTDTVCGGYATWTGSGSNAVTAWGDDTQSPAKDGFSAGEAFNWRVWKATDGAIINMTATYSAGFPNSGNYTTNGMSAIATLSGSYTPAVGSSAIVTFEITQPTELLITASNIGASCFGGNDGSIDIEVTGGVSPYTYMWSNSATTQDLTGLAAGTYSVTVTDANNCTLNTSITITEPAEFNVLKTITQPTCYGGMGSVDITVTGGTAPYTYLWSNGATTEDLISVPENLYFVTITDAAGCTTTEPADIYGPNPFNMIETITNNTCYGTSDGSIDMFVSGGMTPYTYTWSTSAITQDITSLTAGSYSLTVTDANGCIINGTYTITQPAELVVTAQVSNISCNGMGNGAIDITIAGGTTPYSINWSSGHINQDISSLSAGVYSITVTDANNCVANGSWTITEPLLLEVSISPSDPICFGGNGSIDLTVSGGTTPYIFNWSNGQSTEDINPVAGNYSVTVVDMNGCSILQSLTLSQPTAVSASYTVTDASCFGNNDGVITGSPSGGTSPYTYLWSNGETTKDIYNLITDMYSLTITDANGCESVSTYTVGQPTEVIINTTAVSDVSCFGGSDGSVNISVSGGSSPYTYLWSNTETTANISALTAGTYSVTVTDNNACTANASYTITEPASALTVSGVMSEYNYGVNGTFNISVFGGNDGSINVTATGGTTPYVYYWSNLASTEDISNLNANTYTLTVTDNNGCESLSSFTITEPPYVAPIEVVYSPTDVMCFGGSDGAVDITVTGGTTPYNFVWSNGSVAEDISALTAGTYGLTITDSFNGSYSGSVTIMDGVQVLPDLGGDAAICDGGNYTLDAGSYSSYTWFGGENSQTIVVSLAGTYTVSVSNADGCTGSDSFVLTVNPLPVVNLGADMAVCNGDSYILDAGSFVSYSWATGETTQTLSVSSAATYTVTVTDANGCTGSDDFALTVNALPVVDLGADMTVCDGDAYLLDAGSFSSYAWSNGSTAQTVNAIIAGPYSVTVTDANGCNGSDEFTLTVNALPVVSLGADMDVCDGDSYALDAGSFTSYLWSTGASSQTITVSTAGTYTVTVTDSNGCMGSDEFILTVNTLPVLDLGPDAESCEGIMVIIDGGSWSAYEWSTGATTSTIETSVSGTFSLTVTDANGCNANDAVMVTINPNPVTDLGTDTTICNGASITLDAGMFTTYTWSTGANTATIDVTEAGNYSVIIFDANGCSGNDDINITLSPIIDLGADAGICEGDVYTLDAGTFTSYVWSTTETTSSIDIMTEGTYMVTVTDINGCEGSDDFFLSVYPLPVVDFGTDTITILAGASTTLNPGVTGASYEWSTGETTATIEVDTEARYTVTVTDANGCSGEGEVIVVVVTGISNTGIERNINLYPNPATDVLNISYTDIDIDRIIIFNALGESIKDYNNITNEMKINLNEMKEGIYFLRIITSENTQVVKQFTLIR